MDLQGLLDEIVKETQAFSRKCSIGKVEFKMSILSYEQEDKLTTILDEMSSDGSGSIGDWKKVVLSMAITEINGNELPDIIDLGDDERVEKTLYLKDLLGKLPSKAVDTLFEVYTDLKEESDKELEDSIEVQWFRDPAIRSKELKEKINNAAESESENMGEDEEIIGDEGQPIEFTEVK